MVSLWFHPKQPHMPSCQLKKPKIRCNVIFPLLASTFKDWSCYNEILSICCCWQEVKYLRALCTYLTIPPHFVFSSTCRNVVYICSSFVIVSFYEELSSLNRIWKFFLVFQHLTTSLVPWLDCPLLLIIPYESRTAVWWNDKELRQGTQAWLSMVRGRRELKLLLRNTSFIMWFICLLIW